MKNYFFEIWNLLDSDKKKVPVIIMLFLLVSMLDLAGIAIIGPYIRMVTNQEFASVVALKLNNILFLQVTIENVIKVASISMVILFFLKTIAGLYINYAISRFSVNQQTRLRSMLMKRYQSLPYTEYLLRNSSAYIHSVQILVNHYAKGVVASSMRMISDGIVALVIFLFLLWENGYAVSILIFIVAPIMFLYDRGFRGKLKYYGEQSNLSASNIIQGIHEGLGGLKQIRVFGCERYFHEKVHENSLKYGRFHLRSTLISSAPRYLIELLMIVFVVLIVFIAFSLGKDMEKIIPTLAMFGLAAMRLVPTVNVFSKGLINLRLNRNSVHKLFNDISIEKQNRKDCIQTERNDEKKVSIFERLSLHGVSYSYPSSPERIVLNDINMEIESGQSVGIIGASGAGKTTLLDVFLGLLIPKAGEISFNDCLIENCLSEWRQHIAYIPQEVFLIDNTLKSNIALGVSEGCVDKAQLQKAICMSKVSEFIDKLPSGINTMVGERGIRLSGGQRQRVALARAFYFNRDVLVLDEATSALDQQTERQIVSEIRQLKREKTLIIIAHRLSTVRHCDYIYRLDGGAVVEQGVPQDVLG